MGTRGVWGFRIDGKDKVTYNHWDSYPTGLGAVVMNFIKRIRIAEMKEIARRIELVDEHARPTDRQIQHYRHIGLYEASNPEPKDWYGLLRDVQFHPERYLDAQVKHMVDSSDFLFDSLFCEWAYIVNLDESVLEVYEGFNYEGTPDRPHTVRCVGRYWKTEPREASSGAKYHGVGLVAVLQLGAIRKMSASAIEAKCKSLEKENEDG